MTSKGFKEIWDEFMELGWTNKTVTSNKIQDLELSPQIFLRKYKKNWTLYYLSIGTTLLFPDPWPSMWSEFNVWGGELISLVLKSNPKTEIDKFGRCMTLWTSHIESNLCKCDKVELFEDILPRMIYHGTYYFRDWMKEEYNLALPEWVMNSTVKGELKI